VGRGRAQEGKLRGAKKSAKLKASAERDGHPSATKHNTAHSIAAARDRLYAFLLALNKDAMDERAACAFGPAAAR
jgi:hypothetical protein